MCLSNEAVSFFVTFSYLFFFGPRFVQVDFTQFTKMVLIAFNHDILPGITGAKRGSKSCANSTDETIACQLSHFKTTMKDLHV